MTSVNLTGLYVHSSNNVYKSGGWYQRKNTNKFYTEKLLLPVYTVRDNKKRVQCHCDNECLRNNITGLILKPTIYFKRYFFHRCYYTVDIL